MPKINFMRKFLAVAAVLFISGSVYSQTTVRFGVKAGGNLSFSKITVRNVSVSSDTKLGFFAGGLLEVSPGYAENKFKVQLEALYNEGNIEYRLPGTDGLRDKVRLNQIALPLLAKYFICPQFSVNLGPTFNLNLGGNEAVGNDSLGTVQQQDLDGDDLNTFQIGLAAGATYYVYKGLFIDARYNPVFGQLNKKSADDMNGKLKLSFIQVGIGYKF